MVLRLPSFGGHKIVHCHVVWRLPSFGGHKIVHCHVIWRLPSFGGHKIVHCHLVWRLPSFGGHKIGSPLLCVMEVALLIDLHVDCGVAGAVRCRDRVGCR